MTDKPRWARAWEDTPITEADEATLQRILDDPDPDAPGKLGPKLRARIEAGRIPLRVQARCPALNDVELTEPGVDAILDAAKSPSPLVARLREHPYQAPTPAPEPSR